MKSKIKNISSAVFGIIIICFFLPFMDISCNGQKIISFTGIQMVTGVTIKQPNVFGEGSERQKVDPEPLVIIAFSSAIVGLLLSFIKNRKSSLLPAISAAIGTVALLMLKSKIDNYVLEVGRVLEVRYVYSFWATLILLITAVFLNIYVFSGNDDTISKI